MQLSNTPIIIIIYFFHKQSDSTKYLTKITIYPAKKGLYDSKDKFLIVCTRAMIFSSFDTKQQNRGIKYSCNIRNLQCFVLQLALTAYPLFLEDFIVICHQENSFFRGTPSYLCIRYLPYGVPKWRSPPSTLDKTADLAADK